MERTKKVYSLEFKQQAVELAVSLGNYAQAARQLGVSDSVLYTWRAQFGEAPKAKVLSAPEEEIQRLKKENAELKKVNHILKAAAAFFSQDQLK